jgi:teichuronic acid biosynthesis glycosyltransferase TuaG
MPANLPVSVIMTVYNGEKYLWPALHSILEQTKRPEECIFVEDNSSDSSGEILQEFYTKHHDKMQIKIIQKGKLGRAKALSEAVIHATQPWIAVLDADDIWHPQKLELQMEQLNHGEWAGLGTQAVVFSQAADISQWILKRSQQVNVKPVEFKNLLFTNTLCHSSLIIRRELACYDTSRSSQIDYDLLLKTAQKFRLGRIECELTAHRIHPNQSFESKNRLKYSINSLTLQAKYAIRSKHYILLGTLLLKLGYYVIRNKWLFQKIHQVGRAR